MGTFHPSVPHKKEATLKEVTPNHFCQIHIDQQKMEAHAVSINFEEDSGQQQQQRSIVRRNGIVEPPSVSTPTDDVGTGSPNLRQRRNGITATPFLQTILATSHLHQTDGSRSR